jgi:hypothetical protein
MNSEAARDKAAWVFIGWLSGTLNRSRNSIIARIHREL